MQKKEKKLGTELRKKRSPKVSTQVRITLLRVFGDAGASN
jgi:hypothetical protein